MIELVAIWFATLVTLIVIVKRTEKPQTTMAKSVHRQHYG